MKWFKGVSSIEELRKRYKELLKKYHPDNGGNEEVMKEINSQYDKLFDVLSRSEAEERKTYSKEDDDQFKAILEAISGFNMTVEVIGGWIWAFDSFAYKDRLKELGFQYAPKKRAWTWHSEPYRRYHKGEVPLSSIREKYGSQTIKKRSHQCQID